MISTDYLRFIKDTDKYCEKVINDKETLVVMKNDNKNFVVMGLEEYNRLKQDCIKNNK